MIHSCIHIHTQMHMQPGYKYWHTYYLSVKSETFHHKFTISASYIVRLYLKANTLKPKREKIEREKETEKNPKNLQTDRQTEAETERLDYIMRVREKLQQKGRNKREKNQKVDNVNPIFQMDWAINKK